MWTTVRLRVGRLKAARALSPCAGRSRCAMGNSSANSATGNSSSASRAIFDRAGVSHRTVWPANDVEFRGHIGKLISNRILDNDPPFWFPRAQKAPFDQTAIRFAFLLWGLSRCGACEIDTLISGREVRTV